MTSDPMTPEPMTPEPMTPEPMTPDTPTRGLTAGGRLPTGRVRTTQGSTLLLRNAASRAFVLVAVHPDVGGPDVGGPEGGGPEGGGPEVGGPEVGGPDPRGADVCGGCRDYLEQLDDGTPGFARWAARPVAVVENPGHGDALTKHVGFPVVADADLHRALSGGDPDVVTVLVTDRHGQVWEATTTTDHGELPRLAELEENFRFIAIQCPECDVPDTPGLQDWAPDHA